MSWWARWRRRARLEHDLARELQDHVERRVRALVDAGVGEREARRLAALELGGVEQVKEACRDVRGTRWAHDVAQDVHHGIRGLLKRPGLVVAATLSLGLGIGANTAIFALVDAVLLRALPVRDPEALVMINRSWTNPIGRRSRPGRGVLRWRDRMVQRSVRPVLGWPDRSGRRALRKRRLLRHPGRPPGTGPAAHRHRRPARRRRRRADRGHQSPVLAAALRWRRLGARPHAAGRPCARHNRRRRSGAVPRAEHRPDVRRGRSHRAWPIGCGPARSKACSMDARTGGSR